MKTYQSNSFGNGAANNRPMHQRSSAPHKSVYVTIYDVTLGWILRKLWLGLRKLFVAIKYQFYRASGGMFTNWRFSWFKLGLAAIAIFIVFKKDVQFSINMRAPTNQGQPAPTKAAMPMNISNQKEEFSLGSSLPIIGRERTKTASIDELDEQRVKAYIKRFRQVAQVEMDKFGIPASIKLAQGIIESKAGAIENELETNNHFGAPLADQPYGNAWENWRAHSLLLRGSYPQLFEIGTNYRNWAKSLRELGYNKDKNYDKKLIEAIEKYQLYLLDE